MPVPADYPELVYFNNLAPGKAETDALLRALSA